MMSPSHSIFGVSSILMQLHLWLCSCYSSQQEKDIQIGYQLVYPLKKWVYPSINTYRFIKKATNNGYPLVSWIC